MQQLRRSNRLGAKMQKFMPTLKNKDSKMWFKLSKKKQDCNSTTSSGWLSRRKQRVDESHPDADEQAVKRT